MANVIIKRGTSIVEHRNANVHPGHWDPNADRLSPLDQAFPMLTMMDKATEGEPAKSVTFHWFTKAYNALVGDVNDVYTDKGFVTAYSSGPAAKGTALVIRPETASVSKLLNIRQFMQVEFHSTSVNSIVKGRVVEVEPSGAKPSFTVELLEEDTDRVLEGTGITWCLGSLSESEEFELDEAINEEQEDLYNYLYTDSEPFAISRRELREFSRIIEDKKKERELDALWRVQWRREFNVLEGMRDRRGDRYYAGGLRYFLKNHYSSNIVNWLTVTGDLISAGTDPLLHTLPFLRKCFDQTRPFSKPGSTRAAIVSAAMRSFIDECVAASGEQQISWETNRWGISVGKLRMLDGTVDLIEDSMFNHVPSKKRTMYIVDPAFIKRHEPEEQDTGLTRKKGLQYVPWSAFKGMNGETFISRIKGAWIAEETFSFKHLPSHMIIDNLGLTR